MDFSVFINSCDVRDYHRKIGYKYNSTEAAWLVYMCDSITLSEKHRAWSWIINNMPDESIMINENGTHTCSLHLVLGDFIKMEENYVEYFIEDSDNKVYLYNDSSRIFSSWEKCVRYIIENDISKDLLPISISYCFLDDSMPYYTNGNIWIDSKGKIKSVHFGWCSDYIYKNAKVELDILNFFQIIEPNFMAPTETS